MSVMQVPGRLTRIPVSKPRGDLPLTRPPGAPQGENREQKVKFSALPADNQGMKHTTKTLLGKALRSLGLPLLGACALAFAVMLTACGDGYDDSPNVLPPPRNGY
jgi:hypothetical protein